MRIFGQCATCNDIFVPPYHYLFRMTNLFTAQSSESSQNPTEGAQVVGPEADFSFQFNDSLQHNWS